MLFAYLDDFGHSGPYVDRVDPKHNTNPVFGFAGFVLPDHQVRQFSSFFLQLKQHVLAHDLKKCGKPVYKWEKKGTGLFTRKAIEKYPSVREAGFRLLNEITERNGFVFFHGREKMRDRSDLSSVGLQTTVLAHAIKRLDTVALKQRKRIAIVMDQSSSRAEYLEAAQKSMFGQSACRQLVSPPFEVISHLDQNVQAADWISALLGKLYAFKCHPESFPEYSLYDKFYGERLLSASQDSTVERHANIVSRLRSQTLVTTTVEKTIITEKTVAIIDEEVSN